MPKGNHKLDFDFGEFRYEVANYVRLLILARWKCEPGFLTAADVERWEPLHIQTPYPAWRLLDMAAQSLARLNNEYLERCGSTGVRPIDETTPIGRLIFAIAFLADCSIGGGPDHIAVLISAAKQLKEGKSVDWEAMVGWAALPRIRADLDLLPHPTRETAGQDAAPEINHPPQNLFRKMGDDWAIRYAGGPLFPMKDLVGLAYISELIQHPNRPFGPSDLRGAREQRAVDESTRSRRAAVQVTGDPTGADLQHANDAGEVLDREALRALRNRLQELTCEIEEARGYNDESRLDRLEREKEQLEAEVRSAVGFGRSGADGQRPEDLRRFQRTAKLDQDAVRKAINHAIDRISQKDESLARHLLNSITTGSSFQYSPVDEVTWDV